MFSLLVIFIGCKHSATDHTEKLITPANNLVAARPMVSFTFDDGNTSDIVGIRFEQWNQMILSHLEKENLKAMFFVTGKNKRDEKGQFLLKRWNDNGHNIANHTFNHPNFNVDTHSASIFEDELLRTDSIIAPLSNRVKMFRFPYLKEGHRPAKVDSLRTILSKNDYKNGYVTIDASDWYIDQRLVTKIIELGFENVEIEKYRDFYAQHILERAKYYEKLSFEMNGRHIHHTLLLHHNLTSALFLDNLLIKFKEEGWDLIDAHHAYQDSIFKKIPDPLFAGESLIYSMAKQMGVYDKMLRYPAEDSRYEKEKMDVLGL